MRPARSDGSPGECAAAASFDEVVEAGSGYVHARSIYLTWNSVWSYLGMRSREAAELNLDECRRVSVSQWAPKLAIPMFAVLMDLVPLVLKTSGYSIFSSRKVRNFVTFLFIVGFANTFKMRVTIRSLLSFAQMALNLFVVTSRSDAYPSPFELTFAGFALVFQGLSLVSASEWVIFAYAASKLSTMFLVMRTCLCSKLSASFAVASYGSIYTGQFARDANLVFQVLYAGSDFEALPAVGGALLYGTGVPVELRGANNLVIGAALIALVLRYVTALSYLSTQIGGGPFTLQETSKLQLKMVTNVLRAVTDDKTTTPMALYATARNPTFIVLGTIHVLAVEDRAGRVVNSALLQSWKAALGSL